METGADKASPELEFGTFLRLPHQSRTFSRPADSYIPSSPPSRPTSPTPASPPPPGVFLHGRPAPITSKMRQGAPRLGGLGLGGIVESPPTLPAQPPAPAPPPLPARRAATPSRSPKRSSFPPAVPPAAPLSSSSRSDSPGSVNGRPDTPNSAKAELNGGGASIQRPFLSPEMDKPVAREGAFALDRPKVEDVLRKSTDEDAPQPKELAALDSIAPEPTDDDTTTQDPPEAASPEGFPSPGIAEEENTDIFDRFKSTLADDPKDGEHEMSGTNRAREETNSDRASIRSTGESLFATPETVAASDEEEPVPTLALDNREAETAPAEEEEIAFDGPSQLLVEETPEPQQLNVASTDSQDATPMVGHSRTFEQKEEAAELRSSVSGPSLADALVARADKSASSDGTQRSPAVSVATSVYNSREPSINGLDLGEEEEEERPFSQSLEPSTLKPANPVSDFSISPTYSQTSSLPDGLSPNYTQGVRHLDDPASQYPSPPSSPATSIQASPLLTEGNHLPQVDDSSIYSVDESNKPSSRDTELIEDVPQPSAEIPPKPVEPISYPSEPTPAPLSTERAATPVAPIASLPSSPSSSSPYFDRSTSGAPRRSRFSYQGLGLRMPSSIAPKDVDEPLLTEATSAPIPVIPQKQSQQPRPDAAEPKAPLEANSESAQREATNPTSALFPWLQPSSQREAPSHDTQREEEPSNVHREAVSGYRDETLYPSSPSAYAPSTVTSSPEITQAYRVPVGPTPVKVVSPVVSAAPQLETTPDRVEAQRPVPAAPSQPPTVADHEVKEAQVEPRDRQEIDPSSSVAVHKGSSAGGDEADPNQLSGVGVAVDIGTAVAGALVMGGLAVGQSAWRGLAVGWSAWRGASNQPVMQETKVLEVSDIVSEREEENKAFKSYVGSREPIEEHDGSKKAESSVISTEWGEAEFDAPEGFLEEFKKAMAEIGEEDLAANEQAQIDAQLAAYQNASLQHMDAVASPTFSDNTSLSSSPSTSSLAFPPSNRIARQRESSTLRAPPPETIEEDSADEDEREIEDLMAPVWDSPSRQSRRSLDFPTRHGFTPPPGLTGSPSIGGRPISMISTSSVGSMRSFTAPQAPPSAPSSPRQPAKLSKTSKGILGFGRSKSTSKLSKPASRVPPSPSLPGLTKSQSVLSKESSKMDDSTSQHSKTSSHKTSGRRSSIFNFGGPGKDVPPVPTIESQIKDTTYISYGRAKPERRISNASIPADLYASRDPYLITPEAPGGPALSPSRTRTRTRELTPSSVTSSGSWTNRSEDLGGAPLGRRKSSLRSGSAYDGTSQLTRSSSIVEGGKKLYRVRFGNAMGGIGLRSVADSEAERAGGDRHGQRWVGIGRGRYGNMVIKTDEESDLVYAEQVAQIKKKWRAFGSEQSRDWAAVQIDK